MKDLEAYIIKVTSLKDNDVILTLLTDEGVKDVYGRGYNSVKNKFHILVNTGMKVKVTGVSKKKYFQIYDYQLLTLNDFITKDYDLFIKYTSIIKVILQTKDMHDRTSYMLLEYTIDHLEEFNSNLLIDLWSIYFLKRENIIFEFKHCVKCGKVHNIVTISLNQGGLVCDKCYEKEKILDIKSIRDIKAFQNGNITYLVENGYSLSVSQFFKEALEYYVGIRID